MSKRTQNQAPTPDQTTLASDHRISLLVHQLNAPEKVPQAVNKRFTDKIKEKILEYAAKNSDEKTLRTSTLMTYTSAMGSLN